MKKNVLEKMVKLINFSVKVDANSTNTSTAFQPKLPKGYSELKKK
jgi:cyclic lactone autoinducer peptide